MRIFLSIAAFCDPVLPFTLRRAVQQATRPQNLHLAVVDQSPAGGTPIDIAALAPARVTVLNIDPLQARGPCWARALAMTLFEGEDWFFQIDSHMEFDRGWDDCLITQALALQREQPGFVISSYPNAFEFEGGEPVRKAATHQVLGHVVKPGSVLAADHPVLSFEAHPVASDTPVRGFHVGAGCLFAPGALVQRFPYDPYLYFHGEEQSIAARLFTHGWDIFHMPGLPLYHLYRTAGGEMPARPLHWDAVLDRQRQHPWWQLEARSRARMQALVSGGAELGIYGLGTARSLADYAALSGIDYTARTLAPRAFRGPWRTDADHPSDA